MKKEKIYQICVVSFMIDQFLKFLITYYLKVESSITLIPHFFKIYYLQNKGAAFSSFQGKKYLLILFSLIIFFALARHIRKNKITKKVEIWSLGLIMGGLVGNLIDRLLYGYVIDYLSFTFFGYSFAVFNMADVFIVSGVILLWFEIIKQEIGEKRKV